MGVINESIIFQNIIVETLNVHHSGHFYAIAKQKLQNDAINFMQNTQ